MAEFIYDVIDGVPSLTPTQALVRCKDCDYHGTERCEITYLTDTVPDNEWFCGDGVEREDWQ